MVALNSYLAAVHPDPESQRIGVLLDEFQPREHRRLRAGERHERPVAEMLDDPTTSTADDAADHPLVLVDDPTRVLVALALGIAAEAFEVGEHDREIVGHTLGSGAVSPCRQYLDC